MGHPGRFRYSGGGYTVIQLLITEVTGLPFDQAARDLVLEPAAAAGRESAVRPEVAAQLLSAADPRPFPFRLLRTIGDELGWTGFRPRGWPRRGRKPAAAREV